MKWIDDAKQVARHAWSARLMLLATVIQGASVTAAILASASPGLVIGLVAGLLTIASALVSRFVAQPKSMPDA